MTRSTTIRRSVHRFAIVGLAAVVAGCGATNGGAGSETGSDDGAGAGGRAGSGGGGTGGSSRDDDADARFEFPGAGFSDGGMLQPPPPGSVDPEKVCGLETVPLERLPAELLLVLDRSTSMISDRLLTRQTHWQATTAAMNSVIAETQAGVMWGLKMFPTTSVCSVAPGVERDVELQNHTAIENLVRQSTPGTNNGTPTTAAMRAALAYLSRRTTPNPKYILLATDGEPTCRNDIPNRNGLDHVAAIESVAAAAAAGFHTFVVGIAAQRQAGQALDTLNAMAEAGAEPRAGETKFYSVTSEAELIAALGAIAGQVGSCTFPLSKAPPSADDVAVKADGMRVPRSNTDGWRYGADQRSVVLEGSYCDRAKAGSFKNVTITLGCPGMPVL